MMKRSPARCRAATSSLGTTRRRDVRCRPRSPVHTQQRLAEPAFAAACQDDLAAAIDGEHRDRRNREQQADQPTTTTTHHSGAAARPRRHRACGDRERTKITKSAVLVGSAAARRWAPGIGWPERRTVQPRSTDQDCAQRTELKPANLGPRSPGIPPSPPQPYPQNQRPT